MTQKPPAERPWNPRRVGDAAYSRSVLFPFRWFRPNPPFLEGPLPSNIRDPWARREAWRYHPIYHSRWNMYKTLFPGLGIALATFSAYVVVEKLFFKRDGGHHH